LTKILQQSGYQVSHLSRNLKKSKIPAFYWNPDKGEIDLNCLKDTDCIINLAGTGVADARWTEAYKNEILNSRVNSTRLLVFVLTRQLLDWV
jgi:NAD dependent epimerase/dehydratase family enzyme